MPVMKLKVELILWGWIAEDSEQVGKDYFHPTKQVVDAISKDRPPLAGIAL